MSEALDKNFTVEAVLLCIFGAVLLVGLIVAYEIYRSRKTKQMLLSIAWKKFSEHVSNLKLSNDNIALLRRITDKVNLQDPYSIVKSPHIFESSIDIFYAEEKINSMPSETLAKIRDLRKSLGFLPLSREIAYTSTRQFAAGDRCATQIPDSGPPSHKGLCLIVSVGERDWSIERPEGPSVAPGTWVRMELTRGGDAEYSFKAQVLSDSKGALVLSHTNKLKRTQQRNWVRVDASIPVDVIKVENDQIGDMFPGQIIDMSGGGFGMALPIKLMNGTTLILDFELPGHGQISNLMVKVVRVAGNFKGDVSRFVHSVAFEGDVSKIQEQITQYVFEKQRHDLLIKQS
jgi:c-di-GMP-binding flagellar brake protein YcgR